jgi:iron complex outermembrane receptor protein
MKIREFVLGGLTVVVLLGFGPAVMRAQSSDAGSLSGKVSVKDVNAPLKGASVRIIQLDRSTETDENGYYEFRDVPAGTYSVAAHMHALLEDSMRVDILPGQAAVADFELAFAHFQHEVVVTASAREAALFDSFQAVTVLDTLEIAGKGAFGLGELTENLPGVAKRSFGPGSARPVLRGFDGDRVLVLANGLPTGTLSSQSGEHAEPIDETNLDKIEIVKGPATLLYGSNAIGGVVNAITQHHLIHEHSHAGLRAAVHLSGGTNNNQGAAGANMEYGLRNWLFWAGGRRQVTSDYHTPEGRVENSKTRLNSGHVGVGWFGEKPHFAVTYAFNKGRFGVPFAGEFHQHDEEESGELPGHGEEEAVRVDETFSWQNLQLSAGVRGLGSLVDRFRFSSGFVRWMHKELENESVATAFDNKLWSYRGVFEQKRRGGISGSFGFQGFYRDYVAGGEEALTPPVVSGSFALFALEEVDLKRARLQFGGRFEHTGYDPDGLPDRSFAGFSGAAGIHVPLWKNGAFVANYTRAHRAPALEELYSDGPHIGNLAYEIGDSNLGREASNGIDLLLRHETERVHAEASFFHYRLSDFVFLAFTGEEAHGLRVAEYAQADARFTGGEAILDYQAHPNLWLNLGVDAVRSELVAGEVPLPRIPPLRGRLGVDARYRAFSIKPEIQISGRQSRVYPTETPTAGYVVLNLKASYTYARNHLAHFFSATLFNAADCLYRNHLSFIKDLAPEMGRGIRFSYTLQIY